MRIPQKPQSIQRKQQSFYAQSGFAQQAEFSDTIAASFVAWKLKTSGAQTETASGNYYLRMDNIVYKYPSTLDYVETNTVEIKPIAGLYLCSVFLRCQISSSALAPAKIRLRLHIENGSDDEIVAESVTFFGDAALGEGASFEIWSDYDGGIEWLSAAGHYVVANGDSLKLRLEISGLPMSEDVNYEGYFCGYLLDNRAS